MFYIEKDNKIVLFDEDKQKLQNTIDFMPQYEGLEIKEVEEGYVIYNLELMTVEEMEAKQAQEREEQFNKDFFNTSLGYVRRKVSMATGETKDFLSDLLPTISIGVQMGQPVTIITYNEPDFTQDVTDFTSLQEYKTVTTEFVQECFLQLSNDFKPVEDTSKDTSDQVSDQVTDQVEVQDDNTTDTAE